MQLTVSIGHRVDAERLADVLLDGRFAACVQIVGPITSRFRWEDEIQHASEYLLFVKTTADRADAATGAIIEAHPYDVPEVLVTPVVGGHGPYLDWVREHVD